MLQNAFGGLQGIVDHVMVGNFVGYTGNARVSERVAGHTRTAAERELRAGASRGKPTSR